MPAATGACASAASVNREPDFALQGRGRGAAERRRSASAYARAVTPTSRMPTPIRPKHQARRRYHTDELRRGEGLSDVEWNPAQQECVEQTAAPEQDQPGHRLPAEHPKDDPIRSGRARAKLQHQIGYNREADDARETDRRS